MRPRLFVSVFILLGGLVSAIADESPHDKVIRIISSTPGPTYAPKDDTEQELNAAAALNSSSQLRQFMLSDTVPERIKACYALDILAQRLLRDMGDSNLSKAYKQEMREDQKVLIMYLKQLNDGLK
jgi:hypothetical protein